ncbi:MAG: endonuclease domain-containing protein [Prolixibacteraceae bacterium]
MTNYLENLNFDTSPHIRENAKVLRAVMTNAEKILWKNLRNSKLGGFKFRRQHPINIFIADFYCHEKRLVVEVDGGIHLNSDQRNYDKNRTAEMERWEIMVVRFTNDEVEKDLATVLDCILAICKQRPNFDQT